jgi:hypothetical protein
MIDVGRPASGAAAHAAFSAKYVKNYFSIRNTFLFYRILEK